VVTDTAIADRCVALVLGELVRQLRVLKGYAQVTLAARAKLSQSALSRMEHGTTCPTVSEWWRLVEALQLPPHIHETAEILAKRVDLRVRRSRSSQRLQSADLIACDVVRQEVSQW
jgi:transcriptional regulator with XRE-family HTH domain